MSVGPWEAEGGFTPSGWYLGSVGELMPGFSLFALSCEAETRITPAPVQQKLREGSCPLRNRGRSLTTNKCRKDLLIVNT